MIKTLKTLSLLMLIGLVGDKGSGKTLTAVMLMVTKFQYVVTDIKLKNIPKKKIHQITWQDLIVPGDKKLGIKPDINWPFFEKLREEHTNFVICIDEAHNIYSSRNSMSTENRLLGRLISQIRKVLADDPQNCCIFISQSLRKIDIDGRELMDLVFICESKYDEKDEHWIMLKPVYYNADIDDFIKLSTPICFKAKDYYKYYDRLALNTLAI